MHLTNYAVNKLNPAFVFNKNAECDDIGHKRSLTSVFELLENKGVDIDELWDHIQQIIIKTMCAVQPSLANAYKQA
jgi:tubulin polyglutamylase TTLL6/13